jgi:hypothetical protein
MVQVIIQVEVVERHPTKLSRDQSNLTLTAPVPDTYNANSCIDTERTKKHFWQKLDSA